MIDLAASVVVSMLLPLILVVPLASEIVTPSSVTLSVSTSPLMLWIVSAISSLVLVISAFDRA